MECNENKCLNVECFRDRVPSQKEGYLTLFTSAAALGNRNYLARLLLLILLKFLRDGEMRLGVVGHGDRHMANACSSFRAHYPLGSTSRVCSGFSRKALAVPLNQQRAGEQRQVPLRLVLSVLGLETLCLGTVFSKTLRLLIYSTCHALDSSWATHDWQEDRSQSPLSPVHVDKEVIWLHLSRHWYWEGICSKAEGDGDQTPRLQIDITCRGITLNPGRNGWHFSLKGFKSGTSQPLVHCSLV